MKAISGWKFFSMACALSLLVSCGGGDGDSGPDPDPVPAPAAATLVFPGNNTECNEGVILSDTQSRVLFQWNASQNTDSYQINLKNLNTNSVSRSNSNTNEAEIVLLRGVPYEWFVVSRANGTNETASSPVWRFYNAGAGTTGYAPFPAEAVAPTRGANLPAATRITLEWTASDIEDDITAFTLYFGTANPPPQIEEGLTDPSYEVPVISGETYYWQVETLDAAGNRTRSELFNFRVD